MEDSGRAYICTLRSARVALGDGGVTSTDRAMKPATNETTVVKKPKTFCPRTRAECIAAVGEGVGRVVLTEVCWSLVWIRGQWLRLIDEEKVAFSAELRLSLVSLSPGSYVQPRYDLLSQWNIFYYYKKLRPNAVSNGAVWQPCLPLRLGIDGQI
jgi:hypothetical protein